MTDTPKTETTYVVLAQEEQSVDSSTNSGLNDIAGTWRELGRYTARSGEAAIRAYCEQTASTSAMVLVAVPSRSFSPVKVTPRVATTLVIEDVQP